MVSSILAVQEKLARLTELVQQNLTEAQKCQNSWYDRQARDREFRPGEEVLVGPQQMTTYYQNSKALSNCVASGTCML